MRASHRRQMVREISKSWRNVENDLWAIYKWADMANFPSVSGGGGGSPQAGTHSDPVGDKGTAAADGHYDDPSIKAAKEADTTLFRIMRNLRTLEYCISTAKSPHIVSERDAQSCTACSRPRFENPSGWTLGMHRACYDAERRKARRRKK